MTHKPGYARYYGADTERRMAAWLRLRTRWIDARRYLAGDGHQPGDLDAIPGVCIEAKGREEFRGASWLAQVDEEARGRLPVVWLRLRGIPDPGEWPIMLRARHFFALYAQLEDADARIADLEVRIASRVRA